MNMKTNQINIRRLSLAIIIIVVIYISLLCLFWPRYKNILTVHMEQSNGQSFWSHLEETKYAHRSRTTKKEAPRELSQFIDRRPLIVLARYGGGYTVNMPGEAQVGPTLFVLYDDGLIIFLRKNARWGTNWDSSEFLVGDLDVQALRNSLQTNNKQNALVLEKLGITTDKLNQVTEQDFVRAFNELLNMYDFHIRVDANTYEPVIPREMKTLLARALEYPDRKRSDAEYMSLNKALLQAMYPSEIQKGPNSYRNNYEELVSVVLSEKERDDFLDALSIGKEFYEIDHIEYAPMAPYYFDAYEYCLYVWGKEKVEKRLCVTGFPSDEYTQRPFLDAFNKLYSYQNPKAKPWTPEKIKIFVSDNGELPNNNTASWPDGWPDIEQDVEDPKTKLLYEGGYTFYLDSTRYEDLLKLLQKVDDQHPLVIHGRWCGVTIKFSVPNEDHWAE